MSGVNRRESVTVGECCIAVERRQHTRLCRAHSSLSQVTANAGRLEPFHYSFFKIGSVGRGCTMRCFHRFSIWLVPAPLFDSEPQQAIIAGVRRGDVTRNGGGAPDKPLHFSLTSPGLTGEAGPWSYATRSEAKCCKRLSDRLCLASRKGARHVRSQGGRGHFAPSH
jgi:hypothetical protein